MRVALWVSDRLKLLTWIWTPARPASLAGNTVHCAGGEASLFERCPFLFDFRAVIGAGLLAPFIPDRQALLAKLKFANHSNVEPAAVSLVSIRRYRGQSALEFLDIGSPREGVF